MTPDAALFSPCRTWRYSLTRALDGEGTVAFVGLNPSTADETTDDPTVRRCVGFARGWGFARLEVVNLYAFRATNPRQLWRADDPVGPENDRVLASVVAGADLVVAAWGTQPRPGRLAELAGILGGRPLHALALTKDGAPRHPLYVRGDVRPSLYVSARSATRSA
jgi:hypothetical protein